MYNEFMVYVFLPSLLFTIFFLQMFNYWKQFISDWLDPDCSGKWDKTPSNKIDINSYYPSIMKKSLKIDYLNKRRFRKDAYFLVLAGRHTNKRRTNMSKINKILYDLGYKDAYLRNSYSIDQKNYIIRMDKFRKRSVYGKFGGGHIDG